MTRSGSETSTPTCTTSSASSTDTTDIVKEVTVPTQPVKQEVTFPQEVVGHVDAADFQTVDIRPRLSQGLLNRLDNATYATTDEGQVEEIEDFEDDEEEEAGNSCFVQTVKVLYTILFGSRSGLAMYVVLVICLIVLSVFNYAHTEPAPTLTYLIFGLIALAIIEVLQLIKMVWIKVIIQGCFPESRILPFISDLVHPYLPNLIFTSSLYVIWQVCQEGVDVPDYTAFKFVPVSWPDDLTLVNSRHAGVVRDTLLFILLWSVRDIFVSWVTFRLMLGFLMNFNGEIISYFHKYSLLRRLNAGWIKLLPSKPTPETDGTMERSPSYSTVDPVLAEVERAKAIILKERLESDSIGFERLREESKQRLLRTTFSRDLSKATGDVSKQRILDIPRLPPSWSKTASHSGMPMPSMSKQNTPGESTNVAPGEKAADDHLENMSQQPNASFAPPLQAKRVYDLTPAMKKRRVREFHVEYTGRALPRVLERSHIQSLSKSRLQNMISVNWVEDHPMVIFPDGARTELISKKMARDAGEALFRTLLTFRQSLEAFDETLEQVLGLERNRSSLLKSGGLQAAAAAVANLSKAKLTTETILDERLPLSMIPRGPIATLPMVPSQDTLAPPYDVQDQYGIQSNLIVQTGEHRSAQVDDDKFLSIPTAHSEALPSRTTHWFNRRRKSQTMPEGVSSIPTVVTHTPAVSPSIQRPLIPTQVKGPIITKPLTEAQLAAITAAEIRKVKMIVPDDKECLTHDFFELFMSTQDAKDLMDFLDPGNLGKVTSKMFVRGVVGVYRMRKQMTTSLQAQAEIEGVFRTVCRFFIGAFALMVYLILLGVNPNTILVSGAALVSAAGVVLSFVYTDFIQSIILIVFLNPYRIGDRVRIDGEAQYVKRITTYFTEFESLHGRVQFLSHKDLSAKLLINESRCKNATTELEVLFGERTTQSQYNALKKVLIAFLKSRPLEYVGDSLFMFIAGVGPSQYIKVSFWITHTEGWGNWMVVRTQESNFFFFLMRQASLLGMTYKLPIQRWESVNTQSTQSAQSTQSPITPKSPPTKAWPSDATKTFQTPSVYHTSEMPNWSSTWSTSHIRQRG
eukprot:Blabericola_migrator_1__12920@NODE_84_length_14850_cov_98_458703_g75_i0_p1_GENE_NODE_84_length_14850_cov_98_458703_g75_i0NODE_84_length_14850_cov_98_458703_g75_i0_p1_ORF_typecomplete_len1084_score237_67MS_channel/PF00924_18/2e03MS_channel/PF00924_18/1_3e18Wzy_C/PF04932_15/1Wzy_C/PF04932_15/2_8_NODE_84_length_14850_cov_98_458703_g75_i01047013721